MKLIETDDPGARPFSGSHAVLIAVLRVLERGVFAVVGLLLFAGSFVLAARSVGVLVSLATHAPTQTIGLTANFLDLILLILMLAELAYTVSLSVRGKVLTPEPFLIVGLIAVIRRMLVITVQEVQYKAGAAAPLFTPSTIDLAMLTGVVIAFVFALFILDSRPGGRRKRASEAVLPDL